ncbi:hypothetical protein GCM10022248_17720 [Nonomuraea soli]
MITVLYEAVDYDDVLPQLLNRVYNSSRTPTLDRIDPHADVELHGDEVPWLVEELPELLRFADSESDGRMIHEIERLGRLCLSTPDARMRFIGD